MGNNIETKTWFESCPSWTKWWWKSKYSQPVLKGFLHGQTDKQLFKKNVLIVTYEDVKPYIDRIVSGETSDILLTKPIIGFFLSVGTSGGQPKLMLVIAQVAKKWELFRGLYESPVIKWLIKVGWMLQDLAPIT
ncbi:hypothetical protein V6Z11_A12G154000 [Gossypium hirsutum]